MVLQGLCLQPTLQIFITKDIARQVVSFLWLKIVNVMSSSSSDRMRNSSLMSITANSPNFKLWAYKIILIDTIYKRAQLSVLPQQIWKSTAPLVHDTFREATRAQFSCRRQAEAAAATPSLGQGTRRATLDTIYLWKKCIWLNIQDVIELSMPI